MTETFTPGPWKFGHLGTEALWIGPDYDQTPVAHVDHDMEYARDNSRANAALIAAAPDLLEVALMAEWSADIDTQDGGTECGCPVCGAAKRFDHIPGCKLAAAIAKARGQ